MEDKKEDEKINFKDGLHGQAKEEYNPRPKRERPFDDERSEILHLLFAFDTWDERLLSDTLFGNTFHKVLSKRERFVLEMLVDGKPEDYIVQILRRSSLKRSFAAPSLASMKSTIKRKLKDGFEQRLPGWIRQRKWKSEKEEHEVRDFYHNHPEFLREDE